jgi:hypothetical protein
MISKTMVLNYFQCPRLYWLKYKTDKASNDIGTNKMYNAKKVEHAFLKAFESELVIVDKTNTLDQVKVTQDFIDQGHNYISQATFVFNDLTCMVDLLEIKDNRVKIYEIKAVSDKDNKEVKEVHWLDLTFQKYVLESLAFDVLETNVVYLNHDYTLGDEIDHKNLFVTIPLEDNEYHHYRSLVLNTVCNIQSIQEKPEQQKIKYCKECTENKKNCFVFESKTVLDISGINFKRVNSLMAKGKVYLEDATFHVRKDELSETDYEIVQDYLNQRDEFFPEAFKNLDKLTYPCAYLDFETIQLAVPEFKGTKVYNQVPMQFALIVKDSEQGEEFFYEYLAQNNTNYLFEIASLLVTHIPEGAMIVAHNHSFEKGIIKLLASLFSDYSDHLLSFSWFDTMSLFKREVYRNGNLLGSKSIKTIVPAILGEALNDYAKYHFIKNGEDAMNELIKLHETGSCDQVIRHELLDYCKSDVTNMVKLVKHVQQRKLIGS